ncbi:MAG: hypothetical protein JXP34_21390 [Planctomycetes bacterium]|nr:hypothetical protein [Planctomycetota bacterium]
MRFVGFERRVHSVLSILAILAAILAAGCATGRIEILREPDRPPPDKSFLRGVIRDPGAIEGVRVLDRLSFETETVKLRTGELRVSMTWGAEWKGLALAITIPPDREEAEALLTQWTSDSSYSWGRNRRTVKAKGGRLILIRFDPTVPDGRNAGVFSIETSQGLVEGMYATSAVKAESVFDLPPERTSDRTLTPEPAPGTGRTR